MLKSIAWSAALVVTFLAGALAHSLVATVYADEMAKAQAQIFHVLDIPSASIQTVVPGVKVKDLTHASSGDVGVVEITNVPRHRHNHTDEVFYVVSGTGTATLGNDRYDLKTGDLVVLPRGTPHDFKSAAGFRVVGIRYPMDDPKDFDRLTP
jgi:mannose-6-phosphate isomerase-like protein (cupin superfamily)